ncbi:forkhead box protein I2-like [Mytilus trossulus]|uniref:forkhead box protein I2-like n=1 Tax=Mytilus trossulus TaxID=6551 RepID=UPI00300517BE
MTALKCPWSLSISQQKRKRIPSPCLDNKRQKQERLPKPPYSYTGMIVLAIDNQPDKTITTSVLFDFLRTLFPFFCTAYIGWKHTVRKTLSINRCFECIDRKHPGGKVWTVVFAKVQRDVFLLQKNNIVDSGIWAPTLYQHVKLQEIAIPMNSDCTEAIPLSSTYECPFSSITTSSAIVTEPSSHSVTPDFNFSIDNMFTNINQSQIVQEEIDDFRRADCFDSSPLNVFSIPPPQLHKNRRTKPSKITKTKKYKELEQMINNHASNLFVSPDIAVSNLRMLCDSVTSIFQEDHQVIPEQPNAASFDVSPLFVCPPADASVLTSTSVYSQVHESIVLPVVPDPINNRAMFSLKTFPTVESPVSETSCTSYSPQIILPQESSSGFNGHATVADIPSLVTISLLS